MATVLGIDPGSSACGVAVVSDGVVVWSDTWNLDKLRESDIIARLEDIPMTITHVGIEKQPVGKSAVWAEKTLRRCLVFANIWLKPTMAYPQTWRSGLGLKTRGERATLKQASIDFVLQKYGLRCANNDEAEAICIATFVAESHSHSY